MKNEKVQRMVLAAMFLAIGFILPFFTGQVKELGNALLPMHIPVMLCGLICGWGYGAVVGFTLPLARSLILGMPIMYPTAVCMAFELATYGFVIGFLYSRGRKKNTGYVLFSLVVAMLCGRIVWGVLKAILLGVGGEAFTIQAFVLGGFVNAVPGIILQLVLIPLIMILINKRSLTR